MRKPPDSRGRNPSFSSGGSTGGSPELLLAREPGPIRARWPRCPTPRAIVLALAEPRHLDSPQRRSRWERRDGRWRKGAPGIGCHGRNERIVDQNGIAQGHLRAPGHGHAHALGTLRRRSAPRGSSSRAARCGTPMRTLPRPAARRGWGRRGSPRRKNPPRALRMRRAPGRHATAGGRPTPRMGPPSQVSCPRSTGCSGTRWREARSRSRHRRRRRNRRRCRSAGRGGCSGASGPGGAGPRGSSRPRARR